MKDYYKILGVDRNSSPEEIKRAYRRLAQKYHPDRPGGDEQKFKEINEAYQVLSDPGKRAQYDRFGKTFDSYGFQDFKDQSPFSGFDFDFYNRDIEDIISSMFESFGRYTRPVQRRGSDIEYTQWITLAEAFSGVKKKITYETYITCPACQGKGCDSEGMINCPACNGTGQIKEERQTFFGSFSRIKTCTRCFGTGKIPKHPCPKCGGTGRVKGKRNVEVSIARGVTDGQLIKLAGLGEAGERNAGPGDLYLRVRILPDKRFVRRGDDLYTTKKIKLTDILLQKPIKIKGLGNETITLDIPLGSSFKQRIKIPGQGMPRLHGFGRGCLFIDLELELPKKLSPELKKVLENLEE